MVVDTSAIAGGNNPIFNVFVVQVGDKHLYVEKKAVKKQAVHYKQASESGVGWAVDR
jgi:hypothetical protein